MSISLAMDRAMAVVQYKALGEQVSYESVSGAAKSIYALITSDTFGGGGLEVRVTEPSITCRVQSADVPRPCRGDKITDADGTVYEVDGVIEEARVEWVLQLRRC